jgi:hypothetical protein
VAPTGSRLLSQEGALGPRRWPCGPLPDVWKHNRGHKRTHIVSLLLISPNLEIYLKDCFIENTQGCKFNKVLFIFLADGRCEASSPPTFF